MNFFIASLVCINLFYCVESFNTPFGPCNLVNTGQSYSDSEIQKIIQNKILKLKKEFNPHSPKKKFTIIIDSGQETIYNPHWDWSLGITYKNPEKIIIKDPAHAHISNNKFEIIMEHELNHLMVNRADNKKTAPRWFKEGFAMFYSNEISFNHKIKIGQNINNINLFNLDNLKKFKGMNQADFHLSYALSAIYVLTIQNLYGESALKNIFINLENGKTFDESFYASTLQTIDDFNDIAYSFIKSQYWWFQLIALPNQIFTFLPLLLVIGFIIQSIHNKKIRKQWELEEELELLEE